MPLSLLLQFFLFLVLLSADARAQTPLVLLNSWGTPGTGDGQLDAPLRLEAADPAAWVLSGAVFVVDGTIGAHRLQRFDVSGSFVRGYAASLIDPVSVTVIEGDLAGLPTGNIAVLDAGASEVRILDADTGNLVTQWSVPASTDGDIDFDPLLGTLWVCFTDLHFVQEYSLTGNPLRSFGISGAPGSGIGRFDSPRSVEAREDRLYVADTGNDRAVVLWKSWSGTLIWAEGGGSGSAPGQFDQPWAITSDCEGKVLIADRGNGRIQRLRIESTGAGSVPFELVFDEQWFDDGSTFTDLIDLLDPAGTTVYTGLAGAALGLPQRDATRVGVRGLFALDRATAVLRHFEDDCCLFGIPAAVATTAGGTILITPSGTGPTLADVGATVELEVRDSCENPILGFPFQDLYLDDPGSGEISLCVAGSIADANTDAMGRTTFSGAIAGGGWTQSGLQVYIAGIAVAQVLPINVVSPDLNGDLLVNLRDVSEFAMDFSAGVATFRSDLDRDGQLSLGDIALLALHLGESCP